MTHIRQNVFIDTQSRLRVGVHKTLVTPMRLELEQYTPSEAEEATQVAQTTVRNWRRAGHLTRNDGHARYTLRDLLVLVAMRSLVAKGVTPEAAKAYASEIAAATFLAALGARQAYSPAAWRHAWDNADEMSPKEKLFGTTVLGLSEDQAREQYRDIHATEDLTNCAYRTFGVMGLKAPTWLIIWANDEVQFYYDEDISEETFFGNTSFDEYTEGPVTLYCLGAVASMLIKRLPRPAIKLADGD